MIEPAMESKMTGILNKFYVEHDIHGARLMARSHELVSDCTTDDEIDTRIQMLKDDLDICASELKRFAMMDRRGSLFEGWPSEPENRLEV
jgi:hypothetical protein